MQDCGSFGGPVPNPIKVFTRRQSGRLSERPRRRKWRFRMLLARIAPGPKDFANYRRHWVEGQKSPSEPSCRTTRYGRDAVAGLALSGTKFRANGCSAG
jgi:hypothetical protein